MSKICLVLAKDANKFKEERAAEAKTNKTLDKADKSGTGLIIADGMPYASFVSSKGYDVLDSGLLHADKVLNKKTGK